MHSRIFLEKSGNRVEVNEVNEREFHEDFYTRLFQNRVGSETKPKKKSGVGNPGGFGWDLSS